MAEDSLFCNNSFEIYEMLFGRYWFPFLLKWRHQQLVALNHQSGNKKNSRKSKLRTKLFYYIWLFNTFGVVATAANGSCLYVLFTSFRNPHAIKFEMKLLAIIILLITSLISGLSYGFLKADQDFAYSYNAVQKLSENLRKLSFKFFRFYFRNIFFHVLLAGALYVHKIHPKSFSGFHSDRLWKLISILVRLLNITMFFISTAIPIALLTLPRKSATPFTLALSALFSPTICYGVETCLDLRFKSLWFVRSIIVFITTFQVCNCISLLFNFMVSAVEALQSSLKMLYVAALHEQNASKFVIRFRACHLITDANAKMYGLMISMLMMFGLTLVVGCTVATLKVRLIALRFYWMFPVVNGVVIVFILATLPFAVQVHEQSLLVIERFKCNLIRQRRKLDFRNRLEYNIEKRLHKSLKAMQFKCGIFFGLERESKTDYYNSILDWTIDVLLGL